MRIVELNNARFSKLSISSTVLIKIAWVAASCFLLWEGNKKVLCNTGYTGFMKKWTQISFQFNVIGCNDSQQA